jgi:hypothetical protein
MLLHGRRLDVYRTFENLSVGSNVATHCWLLSLEEEYKANKNKLPDTLYHQVCILLFENVNLYVLICYKIMLNE